MNGRIYDPVIGRVLSPDPFIASPNFTQGYNRYSYCLNNPLRYTDPSGYYERPSWGMTHTYYQGSFGPGYGGSIGPGSGSHWSDALRDEYGNFMIGSANSFNNMYGPGASDIAQGLVSNSDFISQWRQGLISIEKIRENGGYWTTTTTTIGNQQPVYDDAGRIIVVNLPATEVFKKWNPVAAQGGGGDYVNQYGNPSATLDQFSNKYKGKTENQIVFGQSSFLGYKFPNDINKKFRFVSIGNGFSSSAFYPQDLYSNKLGINFFDRYGSSIQQNPTKISEYINWYLSNPDNW